MKEIMLLKSTQNAQFLWTKLNNSIPFSAKEFGCTFLCFYSLNTAVD